MYNDAKKLLEDGQFVEKYGFLEKVLNNSKNTELLYSILWHAGSDSCEDLLQYCEFAGEVKNCADLFMILPTSSGPCCTFNTNPTMYKDSPFNKVHTKNTILQQIIPDFGKLFQVVKNISKTKAMNITSTAGIESGLTLIVDMRNHQIEEGTISSIHNGFKIGIFPQV